ncbi:MAG: RHS repeat-associated core domain-containing protein [Pirellulaceae bacterium]
MAVSNFIWDEVSDNVLFETDENGAVTASYTNLPDQFGELISQERNGVTSYYHYDGENSTRQLTNENQNVTDTFIFTAHGEEVARTGVTTNPFGYKGAVGYYTNSTTNDIYVRARTYQPTTGRWLSADPLGFVDGPNVYRAYFVPAGVDPSGTEAFWICVGRCRKLGKSGRAYINCVNDCQIDRGVIFDDSCRTAWGNGFNPLKRCLLDPFVRRALERYLFDCKYSSRNAVLVKCTNVERERRKPIPTVYSTNSGEMDCENNVIEMNYADCLTYAHELIHADYCRINDKCKESDCRFMLCTEARANARSPCCDPEESLDEATWKACVDKQSRFDLYENRFKACRNVSKDTKRRYWDSCIWGYTRCSACNINNEIDPISLIK